MLKVATNLHGAGSLQVKNQMNEYKTLKSQLRKMIRTFNAHEAVERDAKLMYDPAATYSHIRRTKRSNIAGIRQLKVGNDTFFDENVKNGFIKQLRNSRQKMKLN